MLKEHFISALFERSKEQHFYEINIFTVTFDQFKSIFFCTFVSLCSERLECAFRTLQTGSPVPVKLPVLAKAIGKRVLYNAPYSPEHTHTNQ